VHGGCAERTSNGAAVVKYRFEVTCDGSEETKSQLAQVVGWQPDEEIDGGCAWQFATPDGVQRAQSSVRRRLGDGIRVSVIDAATGELLHFPDVPEWTRAASSKLRIVPSAHARRKRAPLAAPKARSGHKRNAAFEAMYAHLQRRLSAALPWDAKPYALAVDAEAATAYAQRVRLSLADPLVLGGVRVWKFTDEFAAAKARDAFLAQPRARCASVQLFHIGSPRRCIGRSRGLFTSARRTSTSKAPVHIGARHPRHFRAAALARVAKLPEIQRDVVEGVHPAVILCGHRITVAQLQSHVVAVAIAVGRIRTPNILPEIRDHATASTWRRRFRNLKHLNV
jgi:hypothetical protein